MSTRTQVENTQKCRRWTLNKKELAKLKRPKSARNEGKLFLRVRAGCNIVQVATAPKRQKFGFHVLILLRMQLP